MLRYLTTISYLRVLIVLCPTHFLLLVQVVKQLYDKVLINEEEESNVHHSALNVPTGTSV